MLISFVYAVYDDRAVRGLRDGSEPKLIGSGGPGVIRWKALPKKRGEQEPREQYAFGLGPTRPLHARDNKPSTTKKPVVTISQWDRCWPKATFAADISRQGRFVSSAADGRTVVRPMLKLNGVNIEPRAVRQYTFHQNYLALFSFSFLFQGKARHADVMTAAGALGLRLVEFRLGSLTEAGSASPRDDIAPVVALANCKSHLVRLHAISAFGDRYNRKNGTHLRALQPLIFVHDASAEIEDWPVAGPITCQPMGQSLAFALRPRKKCTTWALQSYLCSQIWEGAALQFMSDHLIGNRKILDDKKERWRKRAATSSISASASARDDAQDAIPADVRSEIATYFVGDKSTVLDETYDATIERIRRLKHVELRDTLKGMLGVKV